MPLISWSNEFSVGYGKIDDQHKKLIALINELQDALAVGKGKDVLGKILLGVADYTKMHFGVEEDLMRTHQYAEYAEHKRIHDELMKQVGELLEKSKTGGLFLSTEVMSFLKNWLTHHISGTDKKLGAFLVAKNVK